MAANPDDFDPSKWEVYSWDDAPQGALPDALDTPSAEPVMDIEAQLQDLASNSERQAVYLSPEQVEVPEKKPPGSVVIEDFDGKGGTLIARDQKVADRALKEQTSGRTNQEIIGALTLSGKGKPASEEGALVVQKKTPEGAVQRESVVASPEEAKQLAVGWGEGVEIVGVPDAVQRRKDLINKYAKQYDLSSQLVADYMTQESGGRSNQVSSAGAEGLMQLMPGTAKDMGVSNRMDDEQNVRGGVRYLALLKEKYKGNRELMAAAYNWGMGNVDKAVREHGANWKSVLPEETANYLDDMAGRASGGLSEALATAQYTGGFAIPTDESIAGAVDTAFNKNIPYLQDDPVLGQLDWQSAQQKQGTEQQQQEFNADDWETYVPVAAEKEDNYGWGIKHALMRGLLRAGQLIDLAQGDTEEYAEGAEALKKWEVSEEDAARLAELQESEGFWDALGYYITNPALAMQVVVESLPMSAAPLAGGLAGSVAGTAAAPGVGTVIGGMTGAGLGSFATEYLASIGEALTEHGVDATDSNALKEAFADEELMATARELGRERGIGVAAWDALSMGIAGRMFKPIKALAGAAKKTGAVVGGTSEILAQATAGAMGELSAQKMAGQEYDPAAVAGEFIGEIVPGLGEMAINKATGKDLGGNKPEDTTPPPKKPKVKRNPDGSWSEVDDLGDPADASSAGDVPADVETSIPDTGDVNVDDEAADQVIEPPPPEAETATTAPEPTDTKAPSSQEEGPSEVVEETPVEEMLDDAAAAAAATEEVETESPLIDPKVLGPKVTETIQANEEPGPVRTAWRNLMETLAKRYPDTAAKVPARTFSGTGVAKFFKVLQEEVDLTKDLPEVKKLLDGIAEGKTAEVIQTLDRLTSHVQGTIPSLTDAPIDSIAGQVQAEYNNFMAFYEKAKTVGKGKLTKGKDVLKGTKINMANKLGELSGAVRALLKAAEEAGVLEEAGIGANYGKTMELADRAADAAQAPVEKKTKGGGKTKTISFNASTLLELANNLRDIAEKVTPLLAEAEARGDKAKKAKGKAKPEASSPVTEAPAKPKTETSEAKAAAAQKAVKGGMDVKSMLEPSPTEEGKLSPEQRKEKIAFDKERRAEVGKLIEDNPDPRKLSRLIRGYIGGVDIAYGTVTQLRAIAKTLGMKGVYKLKQAELAVAVFDEASRIDSEAIAKGVAEENAEILAEVKKNVPKKLQKGHVYHAVRKIADVAGIVKNGLKKGTNISVDLVGQAATVLGDVGNVVLVFADKKNEYTLKDYQNDGVATGGMKPVAIVADSLTKAEIAELGKTGLPVYVGGKRVAAKGTAAKKPKKAAKKPDVKPEEIFDPEPQNIVGRESATLAETAGVEPGQGALDRALEKIGVSKASVKKLRGIMKAVSSEQRDQIVEAAYRHVRTPDPIRLVSDITEIVGKRVSPEVYDTIAEFALEISERRDARLAEIEAEQKSFEDDIASSMSEDELEIARMTGAIDPEIDVETTTVDEFGVSWASRLRDIINDIHPSLTGAKRARVKQDRRILKQAMDKIRIEIETLVERDNRASDIWPDTPTASMQEILELFVSALPSNHRYAHLSRMLMKLNLTGVTIQLKDSPFINENGFMEMGGYNPINKETNRIDPANAKITAVYNTDLRHDEAFVRTVLHEMVHAATTFAYATDKPFQQHINTLYKQSLLEFQKMHPDFPAQKYIEMANNLSALGEPAHKQLFDEITLWMKEKDRGAEKGQGLGFIYYGLSNPVEFLAEAFTKPYFQEFLGNMKVEDAPTLLPSVRSQIKQGKKFPSAIAVLIGAVAKFLGISPRNSVLLEVMFWTEQMFTTQADAESITRKGNKMKGYAEPFLSQEDIPDKKVRTNVVNRTADAARARDSKVKQAVETLADGLKNLPRAINLGFMNRDVIERNYRELFGRAAKAAGHAFSPLTQYIKAKQAASQLAEEFAVRATAALKKLQKLDNKSRAKVLELMADTTLAQVWPHVSLRAKENKHLWSKPDKKGVSKLSTLLGEAAKQARKDWVALNKTNPEAAQLLIEMAMLTREIQDRKRIEALRTVGKTYEIDSTLVKQLGKVESKEDIQKLFPGMYDTEGNLVEDGARPADTIIDKKDSKEVKEEKKEKLKEWKERRAIAKTAEEIIKGTSVKGPYFPLRRYGKYVVSSTDEHNEDGEPYVSFHHTRKEAQRVAAALEDKLGISTYVTKKIESMSIPRDVESVTAELAGRMGRRKDGISDHMSKRLQAAMIEIMADNTAYASQLKRMGIDGVAADDMGRAFEEYVFVTKYTLGDLATSYEVHQALKDLKQLQSKGMQDALQQGGITEDEALLVGDVVNELAAQNREDAKDREMSKFQKGVGLIGFFNFLGAPSYWVLNATQTLTVTLPYIGSKWGAKGTAAYMQAAGTILKAAKGAKSYDQFKQNLPPAAQKVVADLEAQGIIQSTIAHQFGDIMTPSTLTSIQEWAGPVGKATATALKLMETIPEGVEKYNRISTALAIHYLSNGDMQAIADGVQATQFNYDSANRARLLKAAPKWAGGGLRAIITPMMMFKSYGIGLTRLLYGSMMDVAIKKGGRVEALKLAGGLITTHTVFGGVAGGLMMAPVQALVWAFNQAFREAGDEFDPEEAVELYLQDVANDTVAALASRGVPAALGVDMSKSINLGNLIWMGNDRINLSDAGGVETMMTTALGPVAQYGITTVREGSRLWKGDPRGNWYDFAAAAIPLKAARGAIRGLKYEMEGVGTDTLTFIEPEDVTGWIRSAMGFRPTGIAMTTDYEYNLMAREQRRSTRKSNLVALALAAETAKEKAEVWEDIQKFNRSLEKRSDWISRGDVARLRSRRRGRQRQYDRERR